MNKKFIILISLLILNSILFIIDAIPKKEIIDTPTINPTTIITKEKPENKMKQKPTKKKTIYQKIDSVLISNYSFSKRWIRNKSTDTLFTKRIRVPSYLPLYKYNQLLSKVLSNLKITISSINENETTKSLILTCVIQNKKTKIIIKSDSSIKEKIKLTPKFVIIIDDFGNQWGPEYIQGFLEFPVPITLAIIPGHWASNRTAKMAYKKGKEVIIHMPMEPVKGSIEKETIKLTIDMNEEQIISNINQAIENIPHAKGLNNHEGSLGTANTQLMSKFFKILKKYDLYFIDSVTNQESVCGDIISSENSNKKNKNNLIKFEKRDLFIDSDSNMDEIEKMFDLAVSSFINKGKDVVVIGHCRKNTITVLNKMVTEKYPELDYSFASELVK